MFNRKFLISFLFGTTFLTTIASASSNPAVEALDRYLFAEAANPAPRAGRRLDGAIVVVDGSTVYERYARNHTPEKKHILWSVSKTVISLLYGVALQEKRLELNDSICRFLTPVRPEQCEIKIQNVLDWSTGIKWLEEYEKSDRPTFASILAMIVGEGRLDMAKFVLQQPLEAKPGTQSRYSSGDTMLLAHMLKRIYPGEDIREVFRKKIAEPLGLEHWLWEEDGAGTLAGAYYFYSTPRDLAKIGKLYLNAGEVDGRQILPKEFVNFQVRMSEAFKQKPVDYDPGYISGAHIWINDPENTGRLSPWPGAPKDAVAALGHWGQMLLVIPSLKTVAVTMADCRDGSFERPEYARLVTEVAKWKE